jgi:hypothetical protein
MDIHDFIDFFRSDDFNQDMTVEHCIELFLSSLKGASDITPELIMELCDNYMVDYDEIARGILAKSGYAVENLWHRADMVGHIEKYAEDEGLSKEIKDFLLENALEMMNKTMQGDGVYEQIRTDIDHFWIDHYVEKYLKQQS